MTESGAPVRHRLRLGLAVALAIAALSPTSALAGTAGVIDGTLTVTGGSERNDVTVWWNEQWVVEDEDTTLTPGAGCDGLSLDTVVCPVTGVTGVSVDTGAGNDTIRNFTLSPSLLRGGAGSDTIYGGWGADTLEGGSENDDLFGASSNDRLDGGPGADEMNGGSGADTAVYANRTATVSVGPGGGSNDGEAGEGDDVDSDVEGAELGAGDDVYLGDEAANTVLGGRGDDQLSGAAGDDALEGGEGEDAYTGGAGADVVRSRDGVGESIDCGPDADSVLADPGDAVTNCEQVDVTRTSTPDGGGGADGGDGGPGLIEGLRLLETPDVAVTVSRRGNVALRAQCPADTIGGCSGTITLALVDASGRVIATRRRRRRARSIGRGTFRVRPGGTAIIRVRLSRRGRRTIARRRGRVRLRAQVETVAANGTTTTTYRTLRVKASRRGKRPRRPKTRR